MRRMKEPLAAVGKRRAKLRRHGLGFSLVELLIVLVAMAILIGVAWPAYKDSVHKVRRADARVALLQAAQRLERCHTRHDSYSHESCVVAPLSPEGHYRITEPDPRGSSSFLLRATPIGVQAGDAGACAWLEIDHRGQRAAAGNAAEACW